LKYSNISLEAGTVKRRRKSQMFNVGLIANNPKGGNDGERETEIISNAPGRALVDAPRTI
jgi:hypothetical protein